MPLPKAVSTACFQRDGWKCRHCNSRSGLHPHHIQYKSQGGPDELWNLLTLCAECHTAHHAGLLDIYTQANKLTGAVIATFKRLRGWKPGGK